MNSCYARRISFEINSNSKEIRRVEHEYMNKHLPPISVIIDYRSLTACSLSYFNSYYIDLLQLIAVRADDVGCGQTK